jgi:hypothetical protein
MASKKRYCEPTQNINLRLTKREYEILKEKSTFEMPITKMLQIATSAFIKKMGWSE